MQAPKFWWLGSWKSFISNKSSKIIQPNYLMRQINGCPDSIPKVIKSIRSSKLKMQMTSFQEHINNHNKGKKHKPKRRRRRNNNGTQHRIHKCGPQNLIRPADKH